MNVIGISVEDLLELVRTAIRQEIQQNPSQYKQYQANEYLSIEEAADYLRLPKNTLYNYCYQNTISYQKRGKRNFFLVRDLDACVLPPRERCQK
ncbi:MAG: helix-turn-helix domain-containing protein [Spirosomataceae bacterium]